MKIQTYIILFLMLFFMTGFMCQLPFLKKQTIIPTNTIWEWGGNGQHTGYSHEKIGLPFQLVWKKRYDASLDRAIVASDSFFLFGTRTGRIKMIHTRTGKSIDIYKTGKKIEATCLAAHGLLFIASRFGASSLKAVHLLTNEIVWSQDLGFIDGEPLLAGNHLIVGDHKGRIYALRDSSGDMLWSRQIGDHVYNSAVFHQQSVFAISENGTVLALNLENGEIVWRQELPGSVHASPVIGDSTLYIGTREGRFYALAIDSGEVKWQFDANGGIYKTAAFHDGSVYFGTSQGTLYGLRTVDGKELWHIETTGVIGTSPLLTDDYVFFGTMDRLFFVLNRQTGDELWRYETNGGISTSPILWKGTLAFACDARYVYGFREKK